VIFSIFEKIIQNLDVKPKIKVVTIPGQGGNKGAQEATMVIVLPHRRYLFSILPALYRASRQTRMDALLPGSSLSQRRAATVHDGRGCAPGTGGHAAHAGVISGESLNQAVRSGMRSKAQ